MKKISKKQALRNKIEEIGSVGALTAQRDAQRQQGSVMGFRRSSPTQQKGTIRTPAEQAKLRLTNKQDATRGTGFTGTTTTSQMTARRAGVAPTRPTVR
tara:strand:- start:75 stop:371 length:297 start_codon:yes stop_codon:yes gene_type:complete